MPYGIEKFIAREITSEELRLKGRIVKNDKFGKVSTILYDHFNTEDAPDFGAAIYSNKETLRFTSFTAARAGYIDVFGNGTSVFFFAILKPVNFQTEPSSEKKAVWGIKILDTEIRSIIPGTFDVNVAAGMFYYTEALPKKAKFLSGKISDMAKAFSGTPVNAPTQTRHDVGHHITISFPLKTEVYLPAT